ncbi:hypothetical protein [Shewanella sp. BJSY2023SW005]
MIDHLSSYATDYPKTRDFYLETLSALGYPLVRAGFHFAYILTK